MSQGAQCLFWASANTHLFIFLFGPLPNTHLTLRLELDVTRFLPPSSFSPALRGSHVGNLLSPRSFFGPVTVPRPSPRGPLSTLSSAPRGHPPPRPRSPLSKDFLLMSVHGIRHRGFNVTGRVGHKRSFVAKPHLIFQGLEWTRLCCSYLTSPRRSARTMAPVSGSLSDSQMILLPHLRVVPLYINVAHSKSQLGAGLSAVSLSAWLPVNSSPAAADRRLSC